MISYPSLLACPDRFRPFLAPYLALCTMLHLIRGKISIAKETNTFHRR